MSIVKAGFTPGLHGRSNPASAGRRIAYISRTQDDGERPQLLSAEGPLNPHEAVAKLGGREGEYHGVIVHITRAERAALRADFGSDRAAQEQMVQRLGARLGRGNSWIAAVHNKVQSTGEKGWHVHLEIAGKAPTRLLGKHGIAQRSVDDVWREIAPQAPITDWTKHAEWQALREQLASLQREQNRLYVERRNALRRAPRADRTALDASFGERMKQLADQRLRLEIAAVQARYEARGMAGSPWQAVEVERAEMRRAEACASIDRRSESVRGRAGTTTARDQYAAALRQTDRVLGRGLSSAMRGVTIGRAVLKGDVGALAKMAATKIATKALGAVLGPNGKALADGINLVARFTQSPEKALLQILKVSGKSALSVAATLPTPAAPIIRLMSIATEIGGAGVRQVTAGVRETER